MRMMSVSEVKSLLEDIINPNMQMNLTEAELVEGTNFKMMYVNIRSIKGAAQTADIEYLRTIQKAVGEIFQDVLNVVVV